MRQGSRGGRDVTAVVLAQATLLLSSLAVQAMLAWLLMPAGRGLYAIYAVLAALLPVLCIVGVDRSLQFHLMSARLDAGTALGSMLLAAAGAGALACLVAVLLPRSMSGLGNEASAGLIAAVCALILAAAVYTGLLRLLTATRNFRSYLLATLVQGTANVLFVALLVAGQDYGILGAVVAFAGSYVVGALVAAQRVHAQAGGVGTIEARHVPGIANYALRYFPGLIGHAVDLNAGTLVLAMLVSTAEVGLFAAASALMLRFLLLAQTLQETVLPRIAADSRGRPELVAQLSRLAVAGTALVVLAFCLLAPIVVPVLLSPAFMPAVALMWLVAPGIVLHSSSTLLMPFFEGTNRPGVVSVATWAGLAGNLLFMLLLLPRLGIRGAALALTLGMTVRFAVLAGVFRRGTGTGWWELLLVRRRDSALLRAAMGGGRQD